MDIRTAITLVEGLSTLSEDAGVTLSAFDRWFAGSEFVDASGKPIVLYHGTSKDQDFRSFKMPKNGIWFTADRSSASDYALENDSKGIKYDSWSDTYKKVHTASRVIPVYVKAVKVMHYDVWPDEINVDNYKRAQGILFDKLRMQGYDAVCYQHSVYVVIGSPNQIKSAIGNKGAFDPAKKNIDEDAIDEGANGSPAGDLIRLYHGTNDIMAMEIERYGFQAIGGEGTYNLFKDLAGRVADDLTGSALQGLKHAASGYRTPTIFFTPSLEIARSHAQEHARDGGEIGWEISSILRDEMGIDTDLFAEAKPVVVTVEIPRAWVSGVIKPNQYEVMVHRTEIDPVFIVSVDPA